MSSYYKMHRLLLWVLSHNVMSFFSVVKVTMVTTESGLQYKDIKVGEGPSPPIGFQVSESFLFGVAKFLCLTCF